MPEEQEPKNDRRQQDQQPRLFSRLAVFLFSFFFGTLFGGILMAVNFNETRQQKAMWHVIAFTAVYTGAGFYLLTKIPPSSIAGILINAVGGFVLSIVFWNNYLGDDIQHENRSVLTPLIIALALSLLMLFLLQQLGENPLTAA